MNAGFFLQRRTILQIAFKKRREREREDQKVLGRGSQSLNNLESPGRDSSLGVSVSWQRWSKLDSEACQETTGVGVH